MRDAQADKRRQLDQAEVAMQMLLHEVEDELEPR